MMKIKEYFTSFFLSAGIVLLIITILTSCGYDENNPRPTYPQYFITTSTSVPDSLKERQQQWIVDIVAAASNQMTGGDYEDVDDTIDEAVEQSEKLFGRKNIRYWLNPNAQQYNSIELRDDQMSEKQKKIFKRIQYEFNFQTVFEHKGQLYVAK